MTGAHLRPCQTCMIAAWKVSKDGVISGSYFSVFELNTGKYRPEKTPSLDTFHAVIAFPENS